MTQYQAGRKILVAEASDAIQTIRSIFGLDFTLTYTTSFDDTVKLLHPRFDLIICGVHFDEDRVLELLDYCKANPSLAPIPFLGVRFLEQELTVPEQLLAKSFLEHGGAGYIDYFQWRQADGDQKAQERFYALVTNLASNPQTIDLLSREKSERFKKSDHG